MIGNELKVRSQLECCNEDGLDKTASLNQWQVSKSRFAGLVDTMLKPTFICFNLLYKHTWLHRNQISYFFPDIAVSQHEFI